MLSGVGPRKHVLDGGQYPNFQGERYNPFVNYREGTFCSSAMSCAKTAEPIEMMFGMWIRIGPSKHMLGEVTLAPPGEYD